MAITQTLVNEPLVEGNIADVITSGQYELELEQLEQRRKTAIDRLKAELKTVLVELSKFGVHMVASETTSSTDTTGNTVDIDVPEETEETEEVEVIQDTFKPYACRCGKAFTTVQGLTLHKIRSGRKTCKIGLRRKG